MGDIVTVRFTRLGPDVPIPTRARSGDAAVDLLSMSELTVYPSARVLIGTGLFVEIPPGYAGFILPRSGMAHAKGITVGNSPGLIDSGYRGEVKVALINHGRMPMDIAHGDRIAQLVIQRIPDVVFVEVDQLAESERGTGGFGSTGR